MNRLDQDNSLLKETLKIRRRAMGAGNRSRTKTLPLRRFNWLYPFQFERKYFKYIRTEIMREYSTRTLNELRNNLRQWVDEFRVDSNIRHDVFVDEWDSFVEELRNVQESQFGEVSGQGNTVAFLGDLGNDINDFNLVQSQKAMKIALGEVFILDEPWVANSISTWSQTNFELVKGLTDDYIKQINTIVTNGVQTGALTKDIMKDFRKANKNLSVTRARLIARDQVGKLNGILTKNRQQEAQIEMYTWVTAGDERVRASHQLINGKLCRWDNNTVYSPDGGKTWVSRPISWPQTIPGNAVQCRCQAIPYFNDLIAEIDKELADEDRQAA